MTDILKVELKKLQIAFWSLRWKIFAVIQEIVNCKLFTVIFICCYFCYKLLSLLAVSE